jgi:uncharacterized protein YjbI with pentapeptide repeats
MNVFQRLWLMLRRRMVSWAISISIIVALLIGFASAMGVLWQVGIGVATIILVIGAALLWWWVPKWQMKSVTTGDPKARADVEDNFRKTVGQALGGIAVLLGAVAAYLQFTQQQNTAHDLLISNQVAKGFEQLAGEKITMRLGGIYALEGVMNTSDQYHQPVLEALCAFVREGTNSREFSTKPAVDIQAVLTVITRRRAGSGNINLVGANVPKAALMDSNLHHANLRDVNLSGANLVRADLTDATLSGADLTGAVLAFSNLSGARLSDTDMLFVNGPNGAKLSGAKLLGANLSGAHLDGADLRGADLETANLRHAGLRGTNLIDADPRGADLSGAHLNGANLGGAKLNGANLRDADLSGANLRGINLWGADLRGANLRDADLSDANLDRPGIISVTLDGQQQLDQACGTNAVLPPGLILKPCPAPK